MLTEFEKGYKIMQEIVKKDNPALSWQRLFKPFPFFKAYNHYIMIVICSASDELHRRWFGFVESKIRQLFMAIEKLFSQKTYSVELRPWPKSYLISSTLTQIDEETSYTQSDSYFVGLRVKKNETVEKINVDFT